MSDVPQRFTIEIDRVVAALGSVATVAATALITRCIENTNPRRTMLKEIAIMPAKRLAAFILFWLALAGIVSYTTIRVNTNLTEAARAGCQCQPCPDAECKP